jgi:predicted porin
LDKPLASAGRTTAMVTGGMSMSRFGIKGDEDIGGGTSAGFVLESAINPTNGGLANAFASNTGTGSASGFSSINGQLFSRAAYAKIAQQGIGELQLGRTTSFGLDQVAVFDPLNAAGLYSPLGFSGTWGGGLGATENARLNNSVKYLGGTGQFNWGYQHKFGNVNATELTDISSVDAVTLGYSANGLSLQGTYQAVKDGVTMSASETAGAGGYSGNIANMNGYMLTGKYEVTEQLTVKLGGEHFVLSAPTDSFSGMVTNGDTYYGNSLSGVVTNNNLTAFTTPNKIGNSWWVGGDYKVNQATTVAVGYYTINSNTSGANNYIENTLSAYVDYNFSKSTDVYAAFMSNSFHGTATALPSTVATSNSTVGAGLRVRF